MRKIFTFFIALAMINFVANAQNTTVSDSIHSNATWSGDTVFVDADIVIDDDIILTIDPGVVVVFNDYYKIKVDGTILANGLEGDTIQFTVTDTTGFWNDYNHVGWDGIEFDNSSGDMDDNNPSSFDYCKFTFAKENDDGGVFYIEYIKEIYITNSMFMYNYSGDRGGVISMQYGSEGLIDNCIFKYNYGEDDGGCIDVSEYDNQYEWNEVIISNCIFDSNYSGDNGGVINTAAYANTQIINNIMTNNYCEDAGGAIQQGGYGTVLIMNNFIAYNYAESHGGAIQTAGYSKSIIMGNVILGNYTEYHGGGIKITYETSSDIINNTIVGNEAEYGGGGIHSGEYEGHVKIYNNIIGGNVDSTTNGGNMFLALDDKSYDIQYNDIEYGFDGILMYSGDFYNYGIYDNNIDEDPLFVDLMSGDFSVECGSLVIDAGTMVMGMPMYDIVGNPRINGMSVDMGAVETVTNAMVTSDPENIAVDQGSDATFTVVAEIAEAYLWQISEDFGATWTDLADDANYSGTTTDVLTVSGTMLSMNADMFRCMISGPCEDAPSAPAFLIVNSTANLNSTSSEVAIYPNPSNGIFTIQAQGNVEITNVNGQVIKTIDMNNVNSTKVDMTDFGTGIYFVRISSENTNTVQKIIVK
ncbi:MAG: T9SS type A sorting domain-containing protein [Bacteroidales bacterium]|nr:T9SS type A sorting domain-containing protein [Bacteroidales bacterium]